jgi:hypothetical protein
VTSTLITVSKYAWYVIRHKWFVFTECCKLGIPVQGTVHDLSKLLPDEFIPYMNYFYGNKNEQAFDLAWNHHQKRNKHHHQYWVLREDSSKVKVMEMPMRYRKEMLADWRGAGKAQGKPDTKEWYIANRNKMVLGEETRKWIEEQLGYAGYYQQETFKKMYGGRSTTKPISWNQAAKIRGKLFSKGPR